MQKQAQYTIIKKRRVLDRLDMMSSEGSTAESQVGSQVCNSIVLQTRFHMAEQEAAPSFPFKALCRQGW